MIEFRQKCFTEYDALRSLYNELMRNFNWRNKIKRIDQSALIPILKGNNVVIERFVISKSFFGKDKYRMYLKLGAKVKLPDGVAIPGKTERKKVLGGLQVGIEGGGLFPKNNSEIGTPNGVIQKEFGNGPRPAITASYKPYIDITKEVTVSNCETVKYDMKERSLVLEFSSIEDAVKTLDSLPLGLDYNVYILG